MHKNVIIIRPHRSYGQMRPITTDGVAWPVCLSVCLLVTFVRPAKTAEPIEMLFGDNSPKEQLLNEGRDPSTGRGNFGGCPAY